MKFFPLCPLALLIAAGCAETETEPTVVVVTKPTAVTKIEISPVITPTAPPAKPNTVVIIQPTAKPPKPNVIVVPPKVVTKTETKIIEKPAATLKPTATAKPTAKPTATAKPTPKPAPKPTTKPTAKPAPKPTAAVAAIAQPAPTLIVRAQLISTSKVPDPSTVAYSDSLVFSKYRVVSVEKGNYQPKEILVAQWGMKAKKLTPAARLRAGDSARLQLVPLDEMPKLDRIMRNDDTGDYDSTPYFALEK